MGPHAGRGMRAKGGSPRRARRMSTRSRMSWVVFSYSLPSKARSSPRVALWRRLRRLGAVQARGRVYVLPEREDCVESFQWLAKEVEEAGGDALVMRVQQFEGVADQDLIRMFRQARSEDYRELRSKVERLAKGLKRSKVTVADRRELVDQVARIRRRHAEISRTDYFDPSEGQRVLAQLDALERTLSSHAIPTRVPEIPRRGVEAYRRKSWVTRPRPHVDRLACMWLIRRFIDPHAKIRYSNTPEPGEVAFDMERGEFGHRGNLCTFETMLKTFAFEDQALRAIAEIVHEIDLRDDRYARPETPGLDAVLNGWLRADLSEQELESHGAALFEGLYAALLRPRAPGPIRKTSRG